MTLETHELKKLIDKLWHEADMGGYMADLVHKADAEDAQEDMYR